MIEQYMIGIAIAFVGYILGKLHLAKIIANNPTLIVRILEDYNPNLSISVEYKKEEKKNE
jgi:hypothetical protein